MIENSPNPILSNRLFGVFETQGQFMVRKRFVDKNLIKSKYYETLEIWLQLTDYILENFQ